MVRVPSEDLLRAVELLTQHRADQEVRPGQGSKRQKVVGARPDRIAMAVGAADEEGDGRCCTLPFGDQLGEIRARDVLAALIEGNDECSVGESGEEQVTLARLALRRGELPPLLDFPDIERPSQALGIETLQLEMRPGSGPADGGDQDAQGVSCARGYADSVSAPAAVATVSGKLAPHIFSRL